MSRRGRDSFGLPVYVRSFPLDSFCVLYLVRTEMSAPSSLERGQWYRFGCL